MSHAVQLRGAFWPQDAWGRIGNAALPKDKLAPPVLEAAEEAADLALERFGERLHSVYLSGPAARGRPGGAAFFCLLRMGAAVPAADSWEQAAAAHLRRMHSRLGRIHIAVFNWTDVFPADNGFSPARFRLAVNSVSIAGLDMKRMIPPQKLDSAAMNGDILAFRPRMLAAAGRISAAAHAPERVRAAAMDAGHAVIAAAFALVMEREQIYTEDLDLRRDLFKLNHPNREREIADAFAMAIRPTSEALKALTFIDAACRWMTPLTDAWLNANNPQRAERLRA